MPGVALSTCVYGCGCNVCVSSPGTACACTGTGTAVGVWACGKAPLNLACRGHRRNRLCAPWRQFARCGLSASCSSASQPHGACGWHPCACRPAHQWVGLPEPQHRDLQAVLHPALQAARPSAVQAARHPALLVARPAAVLEALLAAVLEALPLARLRSNSSMASSRRPSLCCTPLSLTACSTPRRICASSGCALCSPPLAS